MFRSRLVSTIWWIIIMSIVLKMHLHLITSIASPNSYGIFVFKLLHYPGELIHDKMYHNSLRTNEHDGRKRLVGPPAATLLSSVIIKIRRLFVIAIKQPVWNPNASTVKGVVSDYNSVSLCTKIIWYSYTTPCTLEARGAELYHDGNETYLSLDIYLHSLQRRSEAYSTPLDTNKRVDIFRFCQTETQNSVESRRGAYWEIRSNVKLLQSVYT